MRSLFTLPSNRFGGMIHVEQLCNEKKTARHAHDFLELVFVCSGKARYHIGDTEGILTAGDYFVIDYNTYHDYYSDASDLTIINCLFRPELIDKSFIGIRNFNEICERYFLRITGRKISGPASNQVFHDGGNISEYFIKLLSEYEDRREGYVEIMRCILCEIIIETVRKIGSKTNVTPLTARIIEEIEQRYNEPLSLSSLCRSQHFSLSYTSARFRADTGLTFTEYLQNRRIEESCRLLTDTDLSVSEIAEAVGYNSIKFFNSVFKSIAKTTPREYRKNNKY